jgi:hypothetical protein
MPTSEGLPSSGLGSTTLSTASGCAETGLCGAVSSDAVAMVKTSSLIGSSLYR